MLKRRGIHRIFAKPSSDINPSLIFGIPKQSAKTESFVLIDEII